MAAVARHVHRSSRGTGPATWQPEVVRSSINSASIVENLLVSSEHERLHVDGVRVLAVHLVNPFIPDVHPLLLGIRILVHDLLEERLLVRS